VLTNSDLWEMVRGTAGRGPTESVWLQVLKRGILRRKYARIPWDRVLSLEGVIGRMLNGKVANVDARAPKGNVTDVDEETVNEARRIGLLLSSISLANQYELGKYGLAFFDVGTGVPKTKKKATKQKAD
jgi:hypothetical protein